MADVIESGYLNDAYMTVQYMAGVNGNISGMQIKQKLTTSKVTGMQARMKATGKAPTGIQARMKTAASVPKGMQTNMKIPAQNKTGMQIKAFLSSRLGMQAREITNAQTHKGMQARMKATGKVSSGMQVKAKIIKSTHFGMQVTQLRLKITSMQATMVIYNVTALRIMYAFPSRGVQSLLGNNWTASSVAPGDFAVKNLNTDIIEQAFRTAPTVTTVTLTCDTGVPQGVAPDTIAILGHNLTKSALVQVQGAKNALFSPSDIVFDMTVEIGDMYYIAPSLPKAAGTNQWWRFTVQDPSNPAGYIQIGTILFGPSHIFSVKETFNNPIKRSRKHFKDVIPTEGFTNVMSDRALKKTLQLTFEKLNYNLYNYKILDDMMTEVRTSLKALVIPIPNIKNVATGALTPFSSRYAVFAKLTDLPEIAHEAIDAENEYIDISLDWDESL